MKVSLTISAVVAGLLMFQGCQEGSQSKQSSLNTKSMTTIQGKTTFGSGLRDETKATVCVDLNLDNVCNENEPQTTTDALGNYEIQTSTPIEEGARLIVTGGINLLPTNTEHLHSKYYSSDEENQNINAMSSLVVQEMNANNELSYKGAINHLLEQYDMSQDSINSDPLSSEAYFKLISALEITMADKSNASAQNKFFDDLFGDSNETNATDSNESILPSLDDVNSVIDEYTEIFDNFFTSLSNYFDNFLSLFTDNEIDETLETNLTLIGGVLQATDLTRDELNGAWYINDDNNNKMCVYIQDNDNVTVIDSEGSTTNLVLSTEGSDENISMIDLSLGFVSMETITLTSFMSDHKFEGTYEDGVTLSGEKTLTLKACKEDRLGLNKDANASLQKGYYVDAHVKGLEYSCGKVEGITAEDGSFEFEAGKDCTFKLGELEVRHILASRLESNVTILEDNEKIAQILQTLDSDGNASNGIQIDKESAKILKDIFKEKRANIKQRLLENLPEDANLTEILEEIKAKCEARISQYKGRVVTRKDAIAHVRNTIKALIKRDIIKDRNITIDEELIEVLREQRETNGSKRAENFKNILQDLKAQHERIRLYDNNETKALREDLIKELKEIKESVEGNSTSPKEIILNFLENKKEIKTELKDNIEKIKALIKKFLENRQLRIEQNS